MDMGGGALLHPPESLRGHERRDQHQLPHEHDHDQDDDLGPETSVDDGELQRQQLSDLDPAAEPRQEAPTPPAASLLPGQCEPDNVADSGEDSEDEWNYYKIEPTEKAVNVESLVQTKKPVCPEPTQLNLEEKSEDIFDMESRLNPDAKEFVPSPTRSKSSFDDAIIAQSPTGKLLPFDNVEIPSMAQFQQEISQRPGEVSLEDALSNSGYSPNIHSDILNGGNIIDDDIITKKYGDTDFQLTEQNLAAFTSNTPFEVSEVSSTKAVYGDESVASFMTSTSDILQKNLGTSASNVEGSFMDTDFVASEKSGGVAFEASSEFMEFKKGLDKSLPTEFSPSKESGTISFELQNDIAPTMEESPERVKLTDDLINPFSHEQPIPEMPMEESDQLPNNEQTKLLNESFEHGPDFTLDEYELTSPLDPSAPSFDYKNLDVKDEPKVDTINENMEAVEQKLTDTSVDLASGVSVSQTTSLESPKELMDVAQRELTELHQDALLSETEKALLPEVVSKLEEISSFEQVEGYPDKSSSNEKPEKDQLLQYSDEMFNFDQPSVEFIAKPASVETSVTAEDKIHENQTDIMVDKEFMDEIHETPSEIMNEFSSKPTELVKSFDSKCEILQSSNLEPLEQQLLKDAVEHLEKEQDAVEPLEKEQQLLKDAVEPLEKEHHLSKEAVEPLEEQHLKDTVEPLEEQHLKDAVEPLEEQHLKDAGGPLEEQHLKDAIEPLEDQLVKDAVEHLEKEQLLVKDTVEPMEKEQQLLKDAVEPMEKEQQLLKDAVEPMEKEQQLLKHAVESLEKEQQLLKDAVEPPEKEQQLLTGTVEPLEKEQQLLTGTVEPLEKEQQLLTGAVEPLEKEQQLLTDVVEPLEKEEQLLTGAVEPLEKEQQLLTGAVEPLEKEHQQLQKDAFEPTNITDELLGDSVQHLDQIHEGANERDVSVSGDTKAEYLETSTDLTDVHDIQTQPFLRDGVQSFELNDDIHAEQSRVLENREPFETSLSAEASKNLEHASLAEQMMYNTDSPDLYGVPEALRVCVYPMPIEQSKMKEDVELISPSLESPEDTREALEKEHVHGTDFDMAIKLESLSGEQRDMVETVMNEVSNKTELEELNDLRRNIGDSVVVSEELQSRLNYVGIEAESVEKTDEPAEKPVEKKDISTVEQTAEKLGVTEKEPNSDKTLKLSDVKTISDITVEKGESEKDLSKAGDGEDIPMITKTPPPTPTPVSQVGVIASDASEVKSESVATAVTTTAAAAAAAVAVAGITAGITTKKEPASKKLTPLSKDVKKTPVTKDADKMKSGTKAPVRQTAKVPTKTSPTSPTKPSVPSTPRTSTPKRTQVASPSPATKTTTTTKSTTTATKPLSRPTSTLTSKPTSVATQKQTSTTGKPPTSTIAPKPGLKSSVSSTTKPSTVRAASAPKPRLQSATATTATKNTLANGDVKCAEVKKTSVATSKIAPRSHTAPSRTATVPKTAGTTTAASVPKTGVPARTSLTSRTGMTNGIAQKPKVTSSTAPSTRPATNHQTATDKQHKETANKQISSRRIGTAPSKTSPAKVGVKKSPQTAKGGKVPPTTNGSPLITGAGKEKKKDPLL